jgi:hypothetical protein
MPFYIFALTALISSSTFALDVGAPVAESLQNIVGEECPKYDEQKAKAALKEQCDAGTSRSTSESRNSANISELKNAMQVSAEDRYFQALAIQHSAELVCGSSYAGLVAQGDKVNGAELEKAFEELRLTKQANLDASSALKNAYGMQVCPMSQAQLEVDIPKAQRALNQDFALCSDVIATREAYQRALSKIPLSGTPAIQNFINQHQVKKSALSNADFQKSLQQAYGKARQEMSHQAQTLLKRAQSPNGPDFNRNEKRALISNPLVTEKVLKTAGSTSDMKALMCSADARYGKGADRLDTALFFGSMVGTGGVAVMAKVGSKALSLVRVAGTGTRFGSVGMAMQVGAYSATMASGASELYRNCARQSQSLQVTQSTSSCVTAPSVQQLKQDSCLFAAGVSGLTFGTTAMSARMAKIVTQTKLTQETTRTAAVEKVVNEKAVRAARDKVVADNKAQGVETLKWKSANSPDEVAKQAKSATASEKTDKSGLRFEQRRSIQESQKKKEQELAAIRAEHEAQDRIEEMYKAQGYEGLELTQKVMRHQEMDRLESIHGFIDRAPESMTLAKESLVKGGKGPFQSKVGDLHLVTPEQLKALPEDTRLYNFRTGEDLVIGVDDLRDPAKFAAKIGGKFTEWGFKAQP